MLDIVKDGSVIPYLIIRFFAMTWFYSVRIRPQTSFISGVFCSRPIFRNKSTSPDTDTRAIPFATMMALTSLLLRWVCQTYDHRRPAHGPEY